MFSSYLLSRHSSQFFSTSHCKLFSLKIFNSPFIHLFTYLSSCQSCASGGFKYHRIFQSLSPSLLGHSKVKFITDISKIVMKYPKRKPCYKSGSQREGELRSRLAKKNSNCMIHRQYVIIIDRRSLLLKIVMLGCTFNRRTRSATICDSQ